MLKLNEMIKLLHIVVCPIVLLFFIFDQDWLREVSFSVQSYEN